MKLIFVILGFLNFGFIQINPPKVSHFVSDYQLQDREIVKRMAEPIEIANQAPNLLEANSYQQEVELTLPPEDLDYMRTNQVEVNLSFSFHFEWWNAMDHQVIAGINVIQSMKSQELIKRPLQIVSRLIWDSVHIKLDRQFAHGILFYFDQNFNLRLTQQLKTDLSPGEINAIARESHGAPQSYRIKLSNLQLNYPVPPIFFHLQTNFLEVPTFYSRNQWNQWWNDFYQIFLASDFFKIEHFDDFFIRPEKTLNPSEITWQQPLSDELGYLDLFLDYREFNYLKLYQDFFPCPKLRVIYHQYLDLTTEFDQTNLLVNANQDGWTIFKQNNVKWLWYLNHYVTPYLSDKELILKPKNSSLVQGEAKVRLIKQKPHLEQSDLQNNFDELWVDKQDQLETKIFGHFQEENWLIFGKENFKNYKLLKTTNDKKFILKALENANFSGSLNLIFQSIQILTKINDLPPNNQNKIVKWPIWHWILLAISLLCIIFLALLKFIKSKPTQN